MDRRRASDAFLREMVHEREEERQVSGVHPFLIERQDEGAALGAEKIVGVLDALGDALAGDRLAKCVVGEEGSELVVGNVGVDCHYATAALAPDACALRTRRIKCEPVSAFCREGST